MKNHGIRIVFSLAVCFAAMGVHSSAEAQSFQLTPFGGWRYGGSFVEVETGNTVTLDPSASFGLILGIPWNAEHRSYLELLWSHQNTVVDLSGTEPSSLGIDIDYLQLGGTVPFPTSNPRLEMLLSGGIGATYMRADLDGGSSELAFSASLAGGLLYHASPRVGLRFDIRGLYTITSSSGAFYCSGGCILAFSGSGFGQVELTGGLQLSF